MVRKIIKALLAGSVLIPTLSFALGLGDIHLHSGLNQQLNAEIDLLSVDPSEADKITVSLASYDTFTKVGLERSSVLMLLSFQVDKHKDGSPYIKITSKSPINDPFLDFLVQVNWPSGQILREYTVLLDPPQVAEAEATPVTAPTTQEEPTAEQPPAQQAEQATQITTPAPVVPTTAAAPQAPEQAAPQPAEAAPTEATAAAEAQPSPSAQAAMPEQPQAEIAAKPETKEQPLVTGEQKPVTPEAVTAPAPAPVGTAYGPVKRNETLYRIASRMRPDSHVTVDQTMIALFNANRDAFMGNNINRLKKGAVLRLDDPAAIKAINQAEATREVARHNQAWQDYRAKVAAKTPEAVPAGTPVATAPGGMAAGTAVATKEEPKLTLVAPTKGNGKQTVGGTAEKGGDAESLRKELMLANETAEARRKENEDLNKRLKELEGQLDKMQKLLALKDDNLAAMQQKLAAQQKEAAAKPAQTQAEAVAPAQPEAAKPAQPATPEQPLAAPAETTTPVEAAKTVTPTTEPAKPAQEAAPAAPAQPAATETPAATPPAGGATPATAPVAKPVQPKPVVKRRPLTPLPPPETSFVDDLLGNPMMLGGGAAGVVILILGVVLLLRRRRQGRGFQESILTVGTTSSMMKGKGENPASETSFLSDLAVSGMGSRVHEEADVDPLTEADVYMAYNRFQQAEDLLTEGLKHNPERDDLNAKLLEVYYRAKNRKQFELLAEARSTSMQKDSAMWQKVMTMGHELCPDNPLFQGAESATVSSLGAAAEDSAVSNDVFDIGLDLDALSSEMEEAGAGSSDFNVDLGLDFSDLGAESEAKKKPDELEPAPSLDFDLGSFAEESETTPAAEEPQFDLSALSEELGEGQPVATEPVKSEDTLLGDLDFDLSAMAEEPPEEAPAESLEFTDLDLGQFAEEAPAAEEPALAADFGDFDLGSLGEETPTEEHTAASIDFGDLDLGASAEEAETFDLGGMEMGTSAEEPMMDLGELGDFGDLGDLGDEEGLGSLDEIGTKLDLAKAYVDMGDADGARGMLEEVIHEGSDDQKRQAKELLEQIA